METILPLTIYANKIKIFKTIALSLVFVAIGVCMLLFETSSGNALLDSPAFRYSVGVAGILFFGFATILMATKITDKQPVLKVDEEGIYDNSTATSVGFIPWKDVVDITTKKVLKQEFIIVTVNNPGEYMEKQKGYFRKKALQFNFNNYESPVAIATGTFNNYKTEDVRTLLQSQLYHARTALHHS